MPTPAVFPVERRAIGTAREAVAGTAVAMTSTVPVDKFSPDDKITGLIDKSWRQAMAGEYAYIPGTTSGEIDMGGPVYADTIGFGMLNILGDYATVGTATTPNTTLTGASNTAGATSLVVTSGTSFTLGMNIQVGTGTSAEVVTVSGAGGSTSIPIANTPLRFNHSAAEAVTNTSAGAANYTHTFTLLNSAANGAQPPTHTLTDATGIPATNLARVYTSACFSDITLTGNPSALFMWDGKATTFLSAIAGAIPTVAPSTVPAQASWNSIVGVGGPASGGTLNSYVDEWVLTINRVVEPYWTASGQQNPYVIVRGALTAALTLKFGPAPDESQFLNFLNNSQPQVQIKANGPSGTSLQIDAQTCAFDTGKLDDSKAAFGYDISAKCIANTTNVGASAAYSPIKITLKNSTPSF